MFANFQFYQSVPPICVMTFLWKSPFCSRCNPNLHSFSVKQFGETMGFFAPIQIRQCVAPAL